MTSLGLALALYLFISSSHAGSTKLDQLACEQLLLGNSRNRGVISTVLNALFDFNSNAEHEQALKRYQAISKQVPPDSSELLGLQSYLDLINTLNEVRNHAQSLDNIVRLSRPNSNQANSDPKWKFQQLSQLADSMALYDRSFAAKIQTLTDSANAFAGQVAKKMGESSNSSHKSEKIVAEITRIRDGVNRIIQLVEESRAELGESRKRMANEILHAENILRGNEELTSLAFIDEVLSTSVTTRIDKRYLARVLEGLSDADRISFLKDLNDYFGELDAKDGIERVRKIFSIWDSSREHLVGHLAGMIQVPRINSLRATLQKISEWRRTPFQELRDSEINFEILSQTPPEKIVENLNPALFKAFEAATEFQWRDPASRSLTSSEKIFFERVLSLKEKVFEALYSGPNALLREIFLAENPTFPRVTASLRHFVETERFAKVGSPWWTKNKDNDLASISGSSSKSPFLKKYGPKAERELFWMMGPSGLDLNKIRIALNKDENGAPRSLEVLVQDKDGWHPFLFERMSQTWVPVRSIKGEAVTETCIQCHVGENGLFSPRPSFLKTTNDFKAVGYKNDDLINELMKFGR